MENSLCGQPTIKMTPHATSRATPQTPLASATRRRSAGIAYVLPMPATRVMSSTLKANGKIHTARYDVGSGDEAILVPAAGRGIEWPGTDLTDDRGRPGSTKRTHWRERVLRS